MSEPTDPFQKGALQRYEVDAFDPLGLHVHYTGDAPVVEFIEAFPVEGGQFILNGVDLFGEAADNNRLPLTATLPLVSRLTITPITASSHRHMCGR